MVMLLEHFDKCSILKTNINLYNTDKNYNKINSKCDELRKLSDSYYNHKKINKIQNVEKGDDFINSNTAMIVGGIFGLLFFIIIIIIILYNIM